jgi:deoxyribonuclease-4
VPVAGGLDKAAANAMAIGAEAIQIFTRNQVQWATRSIAPDEARGFREAMSGTLVSLVVAHGSYLVNLASPDPVLLEKSRQAFRHELDRCAALGIPYLVFHPGAHMGAGEAAGIRAIIRSLDAVLDGDRGGPVVPLLEVTAGQGSSLGHRFEHLAEILSGSRHPDRLGVCLDTCHLFAAGYDIKTPRGYQATLADFERIVGLPKLRAIHLNDAKKGLGSRLDRHARAGEGCLGLATFRRLVNEPRFENLPMLLETPGPLERWKQELELLKRLRRAQPPAPSSASSASSISTSRVRSAPMGSETDLARPQPGQATSTRTAGRPARSSWRSSK